MTDQQQTDLGLWKQNQSQPLPASLKNILIEDCKIYILTKLRNIAEKEKTSYYPNPMPNSAITKNSPNLCKKCYNLNNKQFQNV